MKTGTADLPLHYGDCPRWLFPRMVKLSKAISDIIIEEYGTSELLSRLSNPYWFQAFGCVLGFDWHSSGLTTTVCGALKEAFKESSEVIVAGGKGKVSRKAIEEITRGKYWGSLAFNLLFGIILTAIVACYTALILVLNIFSLIIFLAIAIIIIRALIEFVFSTWVAAWSNLAQVKLYEINLDSKQSPKRKSYVGAVVR